MLTCTRQQKTSHFHTVRQSQGALTATHTAGVWDETKASIQEMEKGSYNITQAWEDMAKAYGLKISRGFSESSVEAISHVSTGHLST